MFLFAALAVAMVLGVSGQATAKDIPVSNGGGARLITYDHPAANVGPNVAAVVPVMSGWDIYPVTGYPCFAPASPCTTDPAGSVVMGVPVPYWPVSGSGTGTTCNNVKKQTCGQMFAYSQTTTGSGAVSAKITMKQGTTVVYTKSLTGLGTASAGQIVVVTLDGPKLNAKAKAGAAKLTIVTTIGTAKATSTATIQLM